MMSIEFKDRLFMMMDRFNQTFGMDDLIDPNLRAQAMWAVIKLGLLQRQIYRSPTLDSIQEFERIQTLLEKTYVGVEKETADRARRQKKAQERLAKVTRFRFPFYR
jgi:hypothetical protein